MDIRITPQTLLANALANVDRHTRALGRLQQQAATGKKILTPSDNPVDLGTLLSTKAQNNRLDTYLTSIQESRSSLNITVSALLEAGNILGQARTIAVEGSHSTNTPQAHEALAKQVDQLLDRMLEVANTQHAGHYLFSGIASQTQPFVVSAADNTGQPLAYDYLGASERNAVPISRQQTVATLYAGSEVFQSRERGVTGFSGTTGAAAGTGTDSAAGQGTLQVIHTGTSYAAGSGVQPGTNSVAGDTIIGPASAHQLTIVDTSGTGASGTVSLNGGPPIAFTNADTNLQVSGPSGEVVFIDTTTITAGFNGTVDITSSGALSVDGGASSVAINFSANQVVTDSVTGAVTNVDSVNIRRTGAARLDYTGTYDAFQILMALRDDLRNTRGLTQTELLEVISGRLTELDRVRDTVLDVVGEQSASLQHMDNLENHVRDVQLSAQQLISDLEDADISEIVVRLQANENLLRLTLATAARLQEQTFLDFMQ
jgi:flagellar hook-associated protein 3